MGETTDAIQDELDGVMTALRAQERRKAAAVAEQQDAVKEIRWLRGREQQLRMAGRGVA